jgi:hypothetical protein
MASGIFTKVLWLTDAVGGRIVTGHLTMVFPPLRIDLLRREKALALAPVAILFRRFAFLLVGHSRVVVQVRRFDF